MAKADGTDILMQLRTDTGAVPAECQTEVDTDMDDFVSDYFNGTFFEVRSFSFGMKIDDQDPAKDKPGNESGQSGSGMGRSVSVKTDEKKKKRDKSGQFARWKTATPDELKNMKRYPVRMDELDINRIFDRASPTLFKYCCDSGSFKSASLIKRKDIGGDKLRGFLRMEFEDLLVTHVGWQNGEDVTEKFKFVFRKVTVRYRATSFKAGQTEAVLQEMPSVVWSYDTDIINSKMAL